MWNINLERGRIWSVKSLNEYDYSYTGMTYGRTYVLIISAFYDITTSLNKFTYLKVANRQYPGRLYEQIQMADGSLGYVLMDEIYTGDQRALDKFDSKLSLEDMNKIVLTVKQYFNLKKCKTENYTIIKQKSVKTEGRSKLTQNIHKFGINITVTPNKYVSISNKGRLRLDKQVKDEIVYNTNTEEEFNLISQKYGITPVKAIHEIKNRLVYQYKHK